MAEINTTATGVSILTGVTPELIDRTTYTLSFTTDSSDYTNIDKIRGGTRFTGKQFEFWEEEG